MLDEDVDGARRRAARPRTPLRPRCRRSPAAAAPPASTSSACTYTAGSTQPPVTEPATSPVSRHRHARCRARGGRSARSRPPSQSPRSRPSAAHRSSVSEACRVTSRPRCTPSRHARGELRQYPHECGSAHAGVSTVCRSMPSTSPRGAPSRRSRTSPTAASPSRVFLALTLRRPLLLEGEPGVGKTEVAEDAGPRARRRADPAPVLRGHRRRRRRSTSGTTRASSCYARTLQDGELDPRERVAELYGPEFLRRAAAAARACAPAPARCC